MHTAKLTDWNFQNVEKMATLKFNGKNQELLNTLAHLTRYYQSYINNYEIDILEKQKNALQEKMNKLVNKVAEIKKEDKFYLFNKELRNEVHSLEKTIDGLTNRIYDIKATINKLGSTSFYKSTELNRKFNKLLKDLGFVPSSPLLKNSCSSTQMFQFEGNEKTMLERAEKIKNLLEENINFTCKLIKKHYDKKQENEQNEELTF